MDLAQALHTAARRYCADQYNHWVIRYSELTRAGRDHPSDGYHDTSEALGILFNL